MNAVRIGVRSLQAALLVIVAVTGAPALTGTMAATAIIQDEGDADGGSAEATDSAETVAGSAAQGSILSVSINAGACDTPDANTSAFALTGAAFAGTSAGGEAYTSETEIPVALTDLLASQHVIAVGLDEADFSIPIACAPLEGSAVGGKLVIGLLAVESDELTGIAVLRETQGGTATLVETYVMLISDTSGDTDGEDEDDEEDTVDGEGGV